MINQTEWLRNIERTNKLQRHPQPKRNDKVAEEYDFMVDFLHLKKRPMTKAH